LNRKVKALWVARTGAAWATGQASRTTAVADPVASKGGEQVL